jgi:hypothetical protein
MLLPPSNTLSLTTLPSSRNLQSGQHVYWPTLAQNTLRNAAHKSDVYTPTMKRHHSQTFGTELELMNTRPPYGTAASHQE